METGFLFETSWEVCNKVGGIHTVVSTKALNVIEELGQRHILIGPDVWRDEGGNPEFLQDDSLFSDWKQRSAPEGLGVRTGRWNIAGKPIVILCDFTPYFDKKDEIFAKFWENYKLDSLSGQWDYVEPALFGYAAGRIIESFTTFYREHHNIVAQFHEWMTGTGVLYLKSNAPWVATSFTTHATALGRSVAGNNRPLYGKLTEYIPSQVAREFNIIAKQSLERISAHEADVFTTVSSITGKECTHFLGKSVDIVTPNGFEDSFVPDKENFDRIRATAREKLLTVASTVLGYNVSKDALLVANSGRYEYRNKGIDLYIDALGELNRNQKDGKECVAFLLVPAYHKGPRHEIVEALNNNVLSDGSDRTLTHGLHYPESDPTLQRMISNGLDNSPDSKVKLIFVPSYLNGNDGIFNMPYFDILIGFDITAFPSYYEPWGYTPLESLMFSIPTVTTTLSGFGMWVKDYYKDPGYGIEVIERTDDNESEVVAGIARFIHAFRNMTDEQVLAAKKSAYDVSRIAMWDNLIEHYWKAYSIALEKSAERRNEPREFAMLLSSPAVDIKKPHQVPVWKDIFVQSDVPARLEKLKDLACNLWWSWNYEAEKLFRKMDPSLWEEVGHNPRVLIERIDYKRLQILSEDEEFTADMDFVFERFQTYLARAEDKTKPKVAYFSMEFGIHPSLKIYSGGLGILAGDYLKEASDHNVSIVGVGLLYRFGYFRQKLGPRGEQMAIYETEDYSHLPVCPVKNSDGQHQYVILSWPGRQVKVRIWEAKVGKVSLYLLDTDSEDNLPEDRAITNHLYGGDIENRLKQELVLGIGGIRALEALNVTPDIYHSNEGHSAFIGFERLRKLISEHHLTFSEGLEVVRASTLFTTHTPVPAGHDAFDEGLLRRYISHYAQRLSITWDDLVNLGRCEGDSDRKFNMSYLATRLSQEVNGVSKLHGIVSRGMFNKLWPGYLEEELHIGHVTNGVHFPTWIAPVWCDVFKGFTGGEGFDQSDLKIWDKIYKMPDKRVLEIKRKLKKQLFEVIRKKLQTEMLERHVSPRKLLSISSHLNENALTIGFARRFATYKRAGLIFKDLDRLSKIVNNPDRPVQFLFAGKAHPHDGGGQDIIKRINEISQMPEFSGKVIFLENYDIELAKYMVRGVDIWLNTPTRPLEASGTSGEKAVMNGTLHFSVLDGWWVEGYRAFAGWALPKKRTFVNQDLQDDVDAETIYNLMENEIIPAYYAKDEEGIPKEWVSHIKNTMGKVAPQFTMRRMMDDYLERYYLKLWERKKRLNANNYEVARSINAWKSRMRNEWDNIEVLKYNVENPAENIYKAGSKYSAEIVLDIKDIPEDHVGVEYVVTRIHHSGSHKFVGKKEFELVSRKNGRCIFRVELVPEKAGAYFYGIRLFAKHPDLPHRQDFDLLRWID